MIRTRVRELVSESSHDLTNAFSKTVICFHVNGKQTNIRQVSTQYDGFPASLSSPFLTPPFCVLPIIRCSIRHWPTFVKFRLLTSPNDTVRFILLKLEAQFFIFQCFWALAPFVASFELLSLNSIFSANDWARSKRIMQERKELDLSSQFPIFETCRRSKRTRMTGP